MSKQTFTYVTYIASTPDKIWDAITDEQFAKQYWFERSNRSDWNVGSTWEHFNNSTRESEIGGKVLENDRPKRLVISWNGVSDAPEEASIVEFDLEPDNGSVKLTVTHRDLIAGSGMFLGISDGWPLVLSSLKTYLESGTPLPQTVKA